MNNFRIFIGIALSPSVTGRLAPAMNRMSSVLPFRTWTHPDDLHVTLHFLGDTPGDRLSAIRRTLEEAAANTVPFPLALSGPGTFGPPAAPRILWLGLNEISSPGALARLHAALAPGLLEAGCRLEDRPFRPHVTLARNGGPGCSRQSIEAAWHSAIAKEEAVMPLTWTADRVTLFLSHLGRRPSYERLHEFPLQLT
ncbi:RNA 2',3'-cyclic phosphodiesterase [Cohnella sp. CFH 77786]|uniref:RNA 2',3'-cyclic phosphodiesterase n=1 Tax=Cohnella sp. CFH 77786 TaxID=2662265 RepID=UPI001C609DA3|nr:RNA 2',3'-cyclic phosphodiesterase [Cohnella sp. CFH 77786]MBW5446897.1 RNA 2',3'-cyclic phosphodiesterase [Cohnella sp. CFH 77786]